MADIEKSIAECCKQLKLSTNFAGQDFEQKGDTPQEYLLNLLTNEIEYRTAKRKSKFLNTAGFPRRYRTEEFRTDEIDFPENVSFQSLLDLDFYHAGKNVIMYGGTGTGKTMLSILIGMSACNREIPVRFYRTAGLINLFSESQSSGKLTALKKKLNSAQILILDEFGYVPYDRTGSHILAVTAMGYSTYFLSFIIQKIHHCNWLEAFGRKSYYIFLVHPFFVWTVPVLLEKLFDIQGIVLLAFGIYGTLFLETVSIFMIEIAILALFYGWRENRINGEMIVYLVSTIAGSIVIFGERRIVGSTVSTVQNIGIENIWALYRRILEYT